MRSVSVRDLRGHLADLLTEVVAGQSIAITKRGAEVARLVPTGSGAPGLPSRAERRLAMISKGAKATPSTVSKMRDEERS